MEERKEGDWFSLNRKLLHSDLWTAEPFTRGQAWADLIGLARWQEGTIRVRGVVVELERGQLGHAERYYADRWTWSRGKVRRFLDELETGHRIRQQKTNVTTVITICNYDRYQPDGTASSTAERPQKDHRKTTDRTTDRPKEKKDSNKGKKDKTPPLPPQPVDEPAADASPADPWRGVGGELAKVGVGKWRSLVADCQQARLTPEIVLALIAHYRQHSPSWGPGALVNRICIQTPEGPAADAGWPDPAAEAVAQRDREQAEKRRKAWDARMDREREQADRDRQRLAELEADHGPTVDAMPRDELRELLSDLPPLAAKVANEGPLSPLVRSMAIELVASRQPQPP